MTVPFTPARCRALTGFWLLLGVLSTLCLPSLGIAETSASQEETPVLQETEAESWLRKMAEARRTQSYEGIFVYGRGDEVSSIQIQHRYKDGSEQERLLHLDGEKREIMREGNRVFCVLPGKEVMELEQSLPSGPFSGLDADHPLPSRDQYHMTLAGVGRVAGFDAVKVAVTARDEYRHSYLLWLDRRTALPLKSLVLDKQGEVLERMQYTSLEVGKAIADSDLKLENWPRGKPLPYSEARPAAAAEVEEEAQDGLRQRWKLQWLPEGFKKSPYQIKRVAADGVKVDTAVYSDGLSAFSVFVEDLGSEPVPHGVSQLGATIAYSRMEVVDGSNYMITVVGEVPLVTARQVADSIQLQAESPRQPSVDAGAEPGNP